MTARLISIIGDANVRRNMTGLNVASREAMKNAQVIDFLGLCPIDQALQEIRAESTIVIIAALTEPLVANGDCGTIFASIDPILTSLHQSISAFCSVHPTLQVFSLRRSFYSIMPRRYSCYSLYLGLALI